MWAWLTNLFNSSEGASVGSQVANVTVPSAFTEAVQTAMPAATPTATSNGMLSTLSSLLDPETLAAGAIKSMGGQGALDAAYSIGAGKGGWGNLFANMATQGGYGSIGDAFKQASGGNYTAAMKEMGQGLQAVSGNRGDAPSGPAMPNIPHYDRGPGGNVSKMLGGIMRAI